MANTNDFSVVPEIIAPERPKRLVKKVVKVRPYIAGIEKEIKLASAYTATPDDWPNWCGPEQDVTVEVWEE